MATDHSLFGGKLHIYQRDNSRFWQCSAYVAGRNHRVSAKTDSLAQAKDFAEDWYLELKLKDRHGDLTRPKGGKTFREAATQFEREFEVLTAGQRSPRYVEGHKNRLRVHLVPFFGDTPLADITAGMIQEYRIHRHQNPRAHPGHTKRNGTPAKAKPPARSTMHQEIVCLRQVLKTANRHGWLAHMPDLAAPFRGSSKVSHRAWFSPDEYKQLYEATRRRAKNPPKPRWKRSCEQLHDYVLFMANTGLRPDEAARLEYRDIEIIEDEATRETILLIEVRGKRGVGYCKSMAGAVMPFRRLLARNQPKPIERLFDMTHRELFNTVLDEEGLKFDRDGQARTAYSLRHTYICLRLMEGADIYQIAKNCRTSVEMIEKYYASHLQNTLDAAAINVRKPRTVRKTTQSMLAEHSA